DALPISPRPCWVRGACRRRSGAGSRTASRVSRSPPEAAPAPSPARQASTSSSPQRSSLEDHPLTTLGLVGDQVLDLPGVTCIARELAPDLDRCPTPAATLHEPPGLHVPQGSGTTA